MIGNYSLVSGSNYVKLSWPHPMFQPEKYQLRYICTLKATTKCKDVTENYVMAGTNNLSSRTTSFRIPNLRPSCICTLIVLAIYNPASIDTGIVLTGATMDETTSHLNLG